MTAILLLTAVLCVQPGDIVLSRNASENTTVGYWNHSAICVGQYVIEAQQGHGVISTPLPVFLARYPIVAVFRPIGAHPSDIERACAIARGFVGTPYRKVTPIFRLYGRRRGDNCTSLVRKIHAAAYGVDCGWIFPDAIARDRRYYLAESKGI